MARTWILGGRVIDPASGLDAVRDVLLDGGRIARLARPGRARMAPKDRHIDAAGLWLVPGLVDAHVHLRQPGMARAEGIKSGSRAAAVGGFTSVVCMPNTRPPLDDPGVVRRLAAAIERDASVRVHIAASLSVDLAGRQSSDLDGLLAAGAHCWSDDGVGTARASVLAAALERSAERGRPVLVHAEDHRLTAGGVMRAGPVARRLGLPGISAASERVRVERDIRILGRVGGRLHLQHLSTVGALRAVRRAKARGLGVTCEATPHHLWLCDSDIAASAGQGGADPAFKMNPPLGRPAERRALREALADGTVDAIATDHAPHLAKAKARGFARAPFGIIGLETALPLTLGLVREGVITRARAIELLTLGPARAMGLADAGRLAAGRVADLTLIDPDREWTLRPGELKSRSRNTPFAGWRLQGRAVGCWVAGRRIMSAGRPARTRGRRT